MRHRRTVSLLLIFLLFVIFFASSCTLSRPKVEEKIKEEPEVEEAQEETSGKDLSDVPRYPNSTRTYYVKSKMEGKDQVMITYVSEEDVETISNWYITTLKEKGWELTDTFTGDEGKTLRFSKTGFEVTIAILRKLKEKGSEYTITHVTLPK